MKKRIVTLLLTLALLFTLMPCALAADSTLTNPAEVLSFGLHSHGPVSIARGVLHRNGKDENVYLMCLAGANSLLWNQNSIDAFLISACSIPTQYFSTAKKLLLNNIPKGANVLLAGHSVGGNIAQQLAADSSVKKQYNIINTLTAGTPEIITFGREGTLHRMCDILDPVPQISLAFLVNPFLDISYEVGNYFSELQWPHSDSYFKSDIWNGFDCLGVRGGSAYLSVSHSDTRNFSLNRF